MLAWKDGNEGRSYGTGFVGAINKTIWLISAGHNFRNLDKNVRETIENCEIFFGNRQGFLTRKQLYEYNQANPSVSGITKHVLLKDIVENKDPPTYVWCHEEEENTILKIIGKDYAAFLLSETKVAEHDLNLHGLLLSEQTIDYKGGEDEGNAVIVFGHPESKDYRNGLGRLELKLSPGKLLKLQSLPLNKQQLGDLDEANHRVFYTNSTTTGSSGSPVLGPVSTESKKMATTKYRVIAIHSGGSTAKFNYGHKMADIVRDMKEKIKEASQSKTVNAIEKKHHVEEIEMVGKKPSTGRPKEGRHKKVCSIFFIITAYSPGNFKKNLLYSSSILFVNIGSIYNLQALSKKSKRLKVYFA